MPNCVVKGCKNQSSKNKKQDGITFHKFPIRNEHTKEKWIEAIRVSRNEPLWKPTEYSVVCSTHFKDDDFYNTKKGLRRVKRNVYPKHVPATAIESIDLDPIKTCSSRAHVPATAMESIDLDPIKTCSSRAHVLATAIESIDMDPIQPCSSRALVPAIPVLSSTPVPNIVRESQSIFDTPRKHELRQRIFRLENKKKQMKTKIRRLNQTVRRLKERNKSLKKILEKIKIQTI